MRKYQLKLIKRSENNQSWGLRKHHYKLLASGILLAALYPTGAVADEVTDLKKQLQILMKTVDQLSERIKQGEQNKKNQVTLISSNEMNATVKETLERVDELEDSMITLDDRLGQRAIAQAFDGIQFDIGGFIHTTYTTIRGENSTESSFDRQNFELLIGAKLNEDWSAFFAGGFLRESDQSLSLSNREDPVFNSVNKNPQIIAWVNYEYNSLLNVRIGRMTTPHGIINIEHFPATLLDPEQPQFLRPFSGDTIFPNFATGIQLHGKNYGENFSFEYSTYATNMSSNAKELQIGARAAVGFLQDSIKMGVNIADGTRVNDDSYDLFGLDFQWNINDFSIKSEYYITSEESVNSVDADRAAFYIQPSYKFSPKWIAFTRFDILEMGDITGESTEVAFGVNFLPSPGVRLRTIYTSREYENGGLPDADADILQFSGTFSF